MSDGLIVRYHYFLSTFVFNNKKCHITRTLKGPASKKHWQMNSSKAINLSPKLVCVISLHIFALLCVKEKPIQATVLIGYLSQAHEERKLHLRL